MKGPQQKVSFEQLIAKVKQAEDVLEARERGAAASYQHLRQVWREGWTPLRIIAAGLVSGFVAGRAEPLRALSGARILQMVSAVSGLFATAQATFAADKATEAADSAQGAAQAATQSAPAPDPAPAAASDSTYIRPSARASRTRDPIHDAQPRPAEAATEISER